MPSNYWVCCRIWKPLATWWKWRGLWDTCTCNLRQPIICFSSLSILLSHFLCTLEPFCNHLFVVLTHSKCFEATVTHAKCSGANVKTLLYPFQDSLELFFIMLQGPLSFKDGRFLIRQIVLLEVKPS